MPYNPFETSAIRCVRDLKEYNLVDPRYMGKDGEPVYAPVINLCKTKAYQPQFWQQLIEPDTFKPFNGSSMSGGSHIRIDYSSSYDAFIMRGKVREINVA